MLSYSYKRKGEMKMTTNTDLIRRIEEAIDNVDWYHQDSNKEMVLGANPNLHQAWYKAEDIYHALESVLSAQSEEEREYRG